MSPPVKSVYAYARSMIIAETSIVVSIVLFGITASAALVFLPGHNPKRYFLASVAPIWTLFVAATGYIYLRDRRTFRLTLHEYTVEWILPKGTTICCSNSDLMVAEDRTQKGKRLCRVSCKGEDEVTFGPDLPGYQELVAELRTRAHSTREIRPEVP